MKGEHNKGCEEVHPLCKCNSCKKDNSSGAACCAVRRNPCPVTICPDYEPDDEEDDHA